jgi:transcriptional regulator with XRE-family HTH domain
MKTKTKKKLRKPIDTFSVIVGRNLNKRRIQRNLTAEESAELLGISRASWYRLVSGERPSMTGELIDQICVVFGLSYRQLTQDRR